MLIPLTVGASSVEAAVDMSRERCRAEGYKSLAIKAVQDLGGHRWRIIVVAEDPDPVIPGG